jgi:hypothetical protein
MKVESNMSWKEYDKKFYETYMQVQDVRREAAHGDNADGTYWRMFLK